MPVLSGKFVNESIIGAFDYLEKTFPVKFYYQEAWFIGDSLDVSFENKTLDDAMGLLLKGRPFTYRVIHNSHVVILPAEEVALLTGQMQDFSGNGGSGQSFILLGNLNDVGNNKMATVTGHMRDGKTGEPIIGATLQPENIAQGAVSNLEGFFRLTIKPGIYTLIASSVGYEKAQYNVKIIGSGELDIELFDKSVALDDIVIYGQRLDKNISSHQMSMVELDNKTMGLLPSVAGGKDILKGLTVMPGVKSIGEFSSGINVRGGGEDQNLHLINGAPLFNTSHVFGLFSVINPDAVEKLSLYKGHIPAVYGERVSSIVDIRTRETAPEKLRVRGGIGLYDSRLMLDVPLIKNKVYFDVGGRMSYSDYLLNVTQDYYLQQSDASFYDINGTLHANLGKSRLALFGYLSNDEFRFGQDTRYTYGSYLGSLTWNYLVNSNLSSNLALAYSNYHVNKDDIYNEYLKNRVTSGVDYGSLKYRVKYGGFHNHTIDAGLSLIAYDVHPGIKIPLGDQSLSPSDSLESEQGYEGGIFINDDFNIGNFLAINIGLRYSAYANTGPGSVAQYAAGVPMDTSSITGYRVYEKGEMIQFYHGFEPRLSARIKINEISSVKLSYNRNLQYLSLISYSSVASPSDIWKLADPYIKPLIANQFAIGYYRNFFNNTIETSVEVYYKGLTNLVEYKNGAQLEMNPTIENQLLNTTGRNYGLEFLLRKNSGTLDGLISYTYSRSLRKTNGAFPEETINNNTYYPSSYDRPHDLSILANYHLNKRLTFSANFVYSSGRPITLPEYKYYNGTDVVVYFSDKNKYRIPDYHRLDLTISLDESLRLKKKWKGSWSFSVLNVYGRKNAYTVYYKMEEASSINDFNQFSMYKLYLIGKPVPTLSYSFIF